MHRTMQIDAWCTDGDVLLIELPSEGELLDLVSAGEKQWKSRIGAYSTCISLCFCCWTAHSNFYRPSKIFNTTFCETKVSILSGRKPKFLC